MEFLVFLYMLICFVLPNTIWQLVNKKKLKGKENAVRHVIWTYVFFIYCALALHVAGIGTIWDLIAYKEVAREINFIPFSSVGITTYLLNIVMFLPFGFLLSLIWERFRRFWKVLLVGFGFSFLIEITQLFNRRISDIDDLFMNTIGACVGYLLWLLFHAVFHNAGKKSVWITKTEPLVYLLLGILGVFLLFNWRPLVAFEDNWITNGNQSSNSEIYSNVACVVCNDGSTENLYYNDLLEKYNNNKDEFNDKYIGAKISFTGIPVGNSLNSFGDENKKYRSLTFEDGWRVEIPYDGYEFIKKADQEKRMIMVSVESFISDVVEYDNGTLQIVLGSREEDDIEKTVITELK